jgi:hypothetical protein
VACCQALTEAPHDNEGQAPVAEVRHVVLQRLDVAAGKGGQQRAKRSDGYHACAVMDDGLAHPSSIALDSQLRSWAGQQADKRREESHMPRWERA